MSIVSQAIGALHRGAERALTPEQRATWSLRAFGLTKVPLLLYCGPRVARLDEAACDIDIPLTWRTRNHYRSMYFGALAVGADCAAGLLALHHVELSHRPVQLLFKDLHAQFLRRPEGDVRFSCHDGLAVQELVADAVRTGERVQHMVQVVATVPARGAEPVAIFDLTVSLKQTRL
jgi:acyl-coenzyme A thioesterase PaaI-like protein